MKPGLRIDSLRVLGFGRFSGVTRELGPGLHLLYGPNEAGKSTLLAFLRSMLFGFEKNGHPERYEPKGGGPFGGELRLTTEAGALLVRRVAAGRRSKGELSVLGPDGQLLPSERLEDALGHVSRELFFDVFAFRLDELAGFERLTEQRGASEALVAASMRGARRLPEVVARLQKSADELYKPNGTKPLLNETLKALEEVQSRLREMGDRPARYFAEKERLGALGEEQRVLEAELLVVGREVERLTRLEAALGDLVALAEARAELESLPALEHFPEGGEARLEDALHRRKSYRAEGARLAERLADVESGLERLSAPSRVRGREEALRLALAAYQERSGLIRTLPARRAATVEKRRQVERELKELGLPVDGPGLLALDLSASVRTALEELATRLGAAESACREASSVRGRARLERERLDGEVARVETELAGLPETRPAQVRQQQAGLGRLRGVRAELERLGEQRTELRRQFEGARTQVEPPPVEVVLPVWWVPAVAAVVVVLSVVAWLLAGTEVAALCLTGGLLLTGVLEMARRRVEAARAATLEAHAARQRGRQQEEERLRSALAGLAAREELLHRELLASAAEAGMAPVVTAADMAAREAALAEALEQAGRREELRREREKLGAEQGRARREELLADEALREAQRRQGALAGELAGHLASRSFPLTIPASAALALWRDAAALKQRLLDVGTEEAALAADERDCEPVLTRLWEEAADTILTSDTEWTTGSPGSAADSGTAMRSSGTVRVVPGAARFANTADLPPGFMEDVSARVASALETARKQKTERQTLDERRRELLAEKARLDGLCHEEETAITALLADGGGTDEESFRRRAAQARRYAELIHRARELSLRLEARTGMSEPLARGALRETGGEEGLRSALESRRARQAEAQQRQKDVLTELGALQQLLEQWENDGELARLRIQEEALKARAAELATRYAADRLALALLSRARRRFEEEQQPRVVQLASEHFSALTGGRYRRVFIPTGEERELRVSDGEHDWSAASLSRGTREQLYLAFRLAVVRDFGETRGALPLIVDDVLVNFDPERARSAIRLFARLSAQQQVIAFTCHPWLREAFEAEGARVQELDSGASASQQASAAVLQAG
ncbi:AAA family ATPase [Myxococcus sp. RHSTA-1-4]|uniref:AAA family ATPase n=1 Tax=Myxococcus sp. RHSTA-1-4 TaxID=2874601 RepID=UPI001CC0A19E|nr:AAA family ATPase [Myxococcus sp. RHSTA-1-4]MBZ4417476.1 AAA family ATPase [Myxococcus sp. RHSTA-1-4]